MKYYFLIFVIILFQNKVLAQSKFDTIEIVPTKITDGIYMLEGSGGNMGLSIGEDGVFLIDDQYAPLTDKIISAIRKLSNKKIRFIFNTHYHDDHTGGNENLGKMGIDIVAHDDVYDRLNKEDMDKHGLPIITFNDRLAFHINDIHIRAMNYQNAHTDADSVIYFDGTNVIHMGDIFENSGYPYVDIDAGGSFIGIINAVEDTLSKIDDKTVIIPGHGKIADKLTLANYHKVLKDIYSRLEPLALQKLTIEDVIALSPLKEYDETWGKGDIRPETFLKFAYTSILKTIK